jgi:hypothetical protein
MSHRRYTLHKDLNAIFNGTALPEDVVHHRPAGAAEVRPAHPQAAKDPRSAGVPIVRVAATVCAVRDEHIKALTASVSCTKDHICYHSGLRTLCRAKPLLGGCLVECVQDDTSCGHRFPILGKALCRCAIRQYIARKLGR